MLIVRRRYYIERWPAEQDDESDDDNVDGSLLGW